MRMAYKAALLIATLLPACGGKKLWATSAEAVLDNLVTGLEDLDADRIGACFDPNTLEGAAVAALVKKTIAVIHQSRSVDAALRDRFPNVTSRPAGVGLTPSLFLASLQARLVNARVETTGTTASLRLSATAEFDEDGKRSDPATQMYMSQDVWYLGVPAPFDGFPELEQQVHQFLDLLEEHTRRAVNIVKSAPSEPDCRSRLAALAVETKTACAPVIGAVYEGFRQQGLLPK